MAWTDKNPDGRWRSFYYDELLKTRESRRRHLWLKDRSLEDSEDLPEPDLLAVEIADDLETALEQFQAVAGKLQK